MPLNLMSSLSLERNFFLLSFIFPHRHFISTSFSSLFSLSLFLRIKMRYFRLFISSYGEPDADIWQIGERLDFLGQTSHTL